ncbi:hypothetical protein FA13DRAFT_1770809 [Coprinellus micaceus]|uniref:Uncharacterized protein n=1 Tax=Coprinellus micaceus TaxID=71717 RepID=A0A4Y7TSS7_COPMI|nr:hypothetical protein FA13DRAFT_1770809 [Coprinellus micaceus]
MPPLYVKIASTTTDITTWIAIRVRRGPNSPWPCTVELRFEWATRWKDCGIFSMGHVYPALENSGYDEVTSTAHVRENNRELWLPYCDWSYALANRRTGGAFLAFVWLSGCRDPFSDIMDAFAVLSLPAHETPEVPVDEERNRASVHPSPANLYRHDKQLMHTTSVQSVLTHTMASRTSVEGSQSVDFDLCYELLFMQWTNSLHDRTPTDLERTFVTLSYLRGCNAIPVM